MFNRSLNEICTVIQSRIPALVGYILYIVLIAILGLHYAPFYVVLVISTPFIVLALRFVQGYRKKSHELMINNLLYAGRGLSSRGIDRLCSLLQFLLATTILAIGFVASYSTLFGFRLDHTVAVLLLGAATWAIYFAPQLLIGFWASQRKVEIEAELPYILILFRVMASLRLPIYDIFNVLEESVALKASSKEMKFARKIATLTSMSFISSVDTVFGNHPSERVRELLRRVVLAAVSMGDIREVVDKVFDNIYNWFEAKVSGLSEKFTIIVGSALFAYMFIPIVVAAIAPVISGSLMSALVVILSVQIFMFFLLYALITSLYPSSLVIKAPARLFYASILSFALSFSIVIYNLFSCIINILRIDDYIVALMLLLLLLPALVLSEVELARVKVYDSFVRMASDALSLAATTGESATSTLDRSSRKYNKGVTMLTRRILVGYTSSALRKAIISRAPSLYYSSFLDILTISLIYGSTPDMLRAFSASFEKLNIIVSRVKGLSRMFEAIMIGLSSMIGGFLAYLENVYKYIYSLVPPVEGGSVLGLLIYDPKIYSLLNAVSLLSIIFVSMFVGKIRGGSIVFSYRAMACMIFVYTAFRFVFSRLLI
ncbi:MAG: hypothetical protein QXK88_02960 [Desulfurococcaceae archaeon]